MILKCASCKEVIDLKLKILTKQGNNHAKKKMSRSQPSNLQIQKRLQGDISMGEKPYLPNMF